MNAQQQMHAFAQRHLAPFSVRGDELIPTLCPFCHGGESQDKYTFALNLTDGVYVCKRGSCGVRGRFEELAQHFGEQAQLHRALLQRQESSFLFRTSN